MRSSQRLQNFACFLLVHMIKHKAEYADKWAFDQEESSEGWGADAAPVNFEQYLKLIAKREVWIRPISDVRAMLKGLVFRSLFGIFAPKSSLGCGLPLPRGGSRKLPKLPGSRNHLFLPCVRNIIAPCCLTDDKD